MIISLSSITHRTSQLFSQSGSALKQFLRPQQPWWVKIHTQNPTYTYYFGPFDGKAEAMVAQAGYVEDLEQENAQNIRLEVNQFSPQQLTIDEDVLSPLAR
ncbi:MAG: DUF1816 domain-containing protein [Spirulina sp.]